MSWVFVCSFGAGKAADVHRRPSDSCAHRMKLELLFYSLLRSSGSGSNNNKPSSSLLLEESPFLKLASSFIILATCTRRSSAGELTSWQAGRQFEHRIQLEPLKPNSSPMMLMMATVARSKSPAFC